MAASWKLFDEFQRKSLPKIEECFAWKFGPNGALLVFAATCSRSFVQNATGDELASLTDTFRMVSRLYGIEVGLDNENLALLGDAAFELSVILLCMAPGRNNGGRSITAIKSEMTSNKFMAKYMETCDLICHMLFSAEKHNEHTIATFFEAIVAAVYFDSGENRKAVDNLRDAVLSRMNQAQSLVPSEITKNYKGILLEKLHSIRMGNPVYLTGFSGTEFKTVCYVLCNTQHEKHCEIILSKGAGRTAKGSEQDAAREALESEVLSVMAETLNRELLKMFPRSDAEGDEEGTPAELKGEAKCTHERSSVYIEVGSPVGKQVAVEVVSCKMTYRGETACGTHLRAQSAHRMSMKMVTLKALVSAYEALLLNDTCHTATHHAFP